MVVLESVLLSEIHMVRNIGVVRSVPRSRPGKET
jgi:hypothetical protein